MLKVMVVAWRWFMIWFNIKVGVKVGVSVSAKFLG